ncbi:DNA sulfur modification protein DndB [Priestia megaterium]|uniref:DNA sulfur modification protein DndB n=1 Tax=Priestia megaterium TaxID=1404 RepID=UPI0023DB3E1D|nr:DNA sulfur modification protein DndB [Priestia megaterium]MDF2012306.1 DNA sulfur modification protein DndB [Priestia megaterium]
MAGIKYFKLNGTEGMQFGKKFYNVTFRFHELENFFDVFQDVQRKMDSKKVQSICEYVLNGLKEDNASFLTSLTTTCRGDILYNHAKEEIHIALNSSLSVNDGQHRYRGIRKAISMLEKERAEEKDSNKKIMLTRDLEDLKNMQIPVVIFSGLDSDMEKQLFHDLNNLAKKPPKSISLKFDQNDLYTRLAKYIAKKNKFLVEFGVEMEKGSISLKNPNLFLLSTLKNSVTFLIDGKVLSTESTLSNENYEEFKNIVNKIIIDIFSVLPADINNREKYIFGKSFVLQGICKFIFLSKNEGFSMDDILESISKVDWTYSNFWVEFGAKKEDGNITFSGSGAGVNGVYRALLANRKEKLKI